MITLEAGSSLQGVAGTGSVVTYTVSGDLRTPAANTNEFKTLAQGQLAASVGVLGAAVPAGKEWLVKGIKLSNTDGTVVSGIKLYVGGSAAANQIVALTIPAYGSATYDGKWSVYDSMGVLQFVGSTGPTGAKGAQWRGTWSGATGYVLDDIVFHNGSAWIAIQAGTNHTPPTLPTTSDAWWNAVSIKGDQGIQGNTGNPGVVQAVGAGSSKISIGGTAANPTVDAVPANFGGASIKDPGTGVLEQVHPIQAQVTGNTKNYAVTDLSKWFSRFNSGVAMTDTLPVMSAARDGQMIIISNDDATAAITLGAGAGQTFVAANGGAGAATFTLYAGRRTQFVWNQAGAFWRLFSNNNNLTKGKSGTTFVLGNVPKFSTNANGNEIDDSGFAAAIATSTTSGFLSFADKKIIDNLHYDFVADFGGVGDDSTLNDTQFANAISALPVGAQLFFPAGIYRISTAININVDKRITFKGVNRYASIIKTTNATQHTFTKSVAGWYDMWTDLGFTSSVTKTAGAAINIPQGNNVGMNVYRCWFNGMFHAINATGAQSANLSVWADLDISGVPNGGRGIVINGSTINVMIHNATINAGAATTSACVEINQSGAVQVTACDWIQGTNVLLINSTAGAGPQACYFTNCFFDQPQGSVVKIVGTNTANRLKFTECGIAPTGNNHGMEIAGTGAGAVGTATALPAGISVVDCDIYSQNGTNTSSGILINGCQDINIQSTRITGFAGAGGSGIRVTPSASNQTKVRINGCIIGPNSNLTVSNTTAIQLDAGASGLGALSITDNTLSGNGTAITDNSTMAVGVSKNINNNVGAVSGLSAQLSSAAGITLGTTEQVILQIPLPPNALRVGTTFRFTCTGTSTTATQTWRIRIGTAGTIADAALVGMGATAALTAAGMVVDGQSQVTAVGASGTHAGAIGLQAGTASSAITPTLSGTFNTASALFVSVCALASASGPVVRTGSLDIISPA